VSLNGIKLKTQENMQRQ